VPRRGAAVSRPGPGRCSCSRSNSLSRFAAKTLPESLTHTKQIHLDLWVEDFVTAHDRVMSLGAKLLKPAQDVDSVDNFQVYADPAGHPFGLCWVQPRKRQ